LSTGTQRWIAACAIVVLSGLARSARAQSGGFVDTATAGALRPQISSAAIQSFLPSRGRFNFPAPYNTEAVRLTNASDCGGQDCVHSVGYSYWRNINNHAGSDTMLIFLGLERRTGGGGPTLYAYNKRTGDTQNRGPLFDANSNYSWATGEGWYFSATQPNMLYVSLQGQSHLDRYDVINHTLSTVFDIASRADLFGNNRIVWQMHSSNDDRVHSATVKDGSSYADLGCVAYREDTKQFFYFPQKGLRYDECQIDKSGRWLVIKEKTGQDPKSEVDNRIIDLTNGSERVLLDRNGAGGHSDNGFGYMVAADNMNPQPGAVRVWRFDMDVTGGEPTANVAGQGTLVYQTTSWNTDIGHVSNANSQNGVSLSQQYACGGNASRDASLPRANEIVCFRLDGSLSVLVVAPNITDLNASGGGSEDYWKLPKGNLDPTGEYFIWAANAGTSRLDAYIVRIPKDKLVSGSPSPTPTPTPSPTPTPTPSPDPTPAPSPAPAPAPTPPPTGGGSGAGQSASWTNLVNVTATGNSLTKTGGCGGCADAGAYAQQQVGSSGFVQFTMSEADTLRFIGLTTGVSGTDAGDLKFALRLQAGRAEVRESGAYKSEIPAAAGDTLRITVSGGSVQYSKNGAVFYTSAGASGSMVVKTSFYDIGATIQNVTIGTASSAATSTNGASGGAAMTTATSSTAGRRTAPASQTTGTAKRRGT
jgi:hypothetical protein